MLAAVVIALVSGAANPCVLLGTQDIARILGWSVMAGAARGYTLPGGTGSMCTFEGREGTVIVTIPSKGTGLPSNDLTSDLGTVRTPLHDAAGFGPPVELGRSSAIIHNHGRDYGITVQPIDAQFADDKQMRALADALIARLPARPRTRR